MHVHSCMLIHNAHTLISTHLYTCSHTCIHLHVLMLSLAHTFIHYKHTWELIHSHTHKHTCTHVYSHKNTLARIYTHVYTLHVLTYFHTHRHSHIHDPIPGSLFSWRAAPACVVDSGVPRGSFRQESGFCASTEWTAGSLCGHRLS